MFPYFAKMWLLFILVPLLFCYDATAVQKSKCPSVCNCTINEKKETAVYCTRGHTIDPLPVMDMPSNARVLLVSPPLSRPNTLTLGPIFKGLTSLREISITHSNIPAIGEHSFWGLRDLTAINISHNALTSIVAPNFRGPEALQTLDLSHNIIESVPSAVFRHVKFLQHLDLSYNRISELVPELFWGLTQLESLDMSHNPLGNLPPGRLNSFPSLLEFKCAACGLLTFQKELLSKMPKIKILDLSQNRLVAVPSTTGAPYLHTLYLHHNLLNAIDRFDLNHLPLKHLSLSNNRITRIENNSFTNTSLTFIDLSFNEIGNLNSRVLEPVIGSLKRLDISGNHLHMNYLKSLLPKAKQLRHLRMTHLAITKLPKNLFRRSRHLRYLNLSSNSLSDFPHDLLYSIPYLQTLDLSLNKFKGLVSDLVSAFKMASISAIHLNGNPWQCQECYVSDLVSWMRSTKLSLKCPAGILKDECLRCAGPPPLFKKSLFRLKVGDLPSCDIVNWELESENASLPEIKLGGNASADFGLFFKEHMALLVGVGCGLVVALMLLVMIAVACCKKQTAMYYTEEKLEPENMETLLAKPVETNNVQELKAIPKTEPVKIPAYEPMAISKVLASTKLYRNGQAGSLTGQADFLTSSYVRNAIINEEPDNFRTSSTDVKTNFYGVED